MPSEMVADVVKRRPVDDKTVCTGSRQAGPGEAADICGRLETWVTSSFMGKGDLSAGWAATVLVSGMVEM